MSVETQLEAHWQALQQKVGANSSTLWIGYQTSPLVPSTWQITPETHFCRYVYAYGNYSPPPPPIIDGQLISLPWARIRQFQNHSAEPTIDLLNGELQALGIQGFRPLTQSEMKIYNQGTQVEQQLNKPLDFESEQSIRNFYRTWLGLNGVISKWIAQAHPDFFEWLKR